MKSKVFGLSVLFVVYALAAVMGCFIFLAFKSIGLNDFLAVLIADVIATVFVWLMGVIFKTASMYDPYWSLQTLCIYLALLFYHNNWNLGTVLLLAAILIYSVRLTANFIIGFDSLSYIDCLYNRELIRYLHVPYNRGLSLFFTNDCLRQHRLFHFL